MSARDFLTLNHVSKVYRRNQSLLERLKKNDTSGTKAVSDVSLAVRHGETLGLVGESGCGKSTLARLVSGLMEPTSGAIAFRRDAAGKTPRLQMIFQDPYSSLNGRWTIEDIIAEPIRVHKLRRGRAAIRARVDELLVQVGLSPADAEKYPQEFSGGQRQRICIARALAGEPEFLILDEPTSALDVSVQAQILNLLRDLQKNLALTSLFITHNLSVVRIMADRIGVMYLGELVEAAPSEELFLRPRHPYTRLLIDAAPDMDTGDRTLHPIAGELPNPAFPPSGCRFHTRCPFTKDICRSTVPPKKTTGADSMFRCHFDLDLSNGQAILPIAKARTA
ncbi:ABC transporter ATP-binding protein [Neorhizobium sp. Rsf11]|uniref:ABC transporter ATP-binding protein n=2 Tax=Neorhizobium TaxID=1525371 RepID=A0ABV0M6H6_9HYPH|nr:ABC transporter ATP-binding protein [Neorhizobium petrolearium]MCC2612604.1 ABC transporter ATP-binding protein [Neorhizobium petrolearium]WGI67728.1 ABC transporter ATP-binding protein [Neorhizobium petrolearium]